MGKNYYEILGVPENASDADIEAAFKVKAREVHPDTVSTENAYLRKVASEAFKDLSEAKAALMDPTTRQKYDASLVYERSKESGSSNSSTPESDSASDSSQSQHRSRTSSRTGSSRRSTQSMSSRARTGSSAFPEIRNLNSFLFLVLGMGTIFFLAVLVASGRMPPLWLAVVTAGIGILLFVNGMRPVARGFSSGRPALIGSAVAVALVLLSLWLFSPSYFEMATTSRIARAVVSHTTRGHAPHPPDSPKVLADSAPDAVVDESGPEATLPTKIWSNLKDGQTYRSRLDGSSLFLDAIAVGGKIGGQFAGCEFHRTGSDATDWVGMCTEIGSGEALRKMPATLNRFSDDRIEGSTGDIPVFVMTPVETVTMGGGATPLEGAAATNGSAAAGATPPAATSSPGAVGAAPPNGAPGAAAQDTTEPDLSALNKSDKEAVELACASERLSQGPAKYNECLRKQLDALKAMPNAPSLAGLSSADREDIVLTCSNEKLIHGPGAYNVCLAQQLKLKKRKK
jgi:hypothetical protein